MQKPIFSGTGTGMFAGAIIAVSLLQLGFWKTVVVVLAMSIGALVARVLEGRLDLRALADVMRGRRSS